MATTSSWTIRRRAVKDGISNDVLPKNNKTSGRGNNTKRPRRYYDDASDSGVLGVQKEIGSSSIHCGAVDGSGSGGGGSGSDLETVSSSSSGDDAPND